MNVKTLLTALFISIILLPAFSQSRFTVEGLVKDDQTKQPLVGATVRMSNGLAMNSDSSGHFSFVLPKDEHELRASFVGYKEFFIRFTLKADKHLDIEMEVDSKQLDAVMVSSSAEKKSARVTIGLDNISIKGVKKLPAAMGEVDILRAIQSLPGITSVGEGANGVNIRGGNVDQNMILIEDMPIYNPTHMFGLFSVFPADGIREIELYKGGIPARFGGRTASVMNVKMLEPNASKFRINGGISPVSNRLTMEIPLIKDKLSFLTSNRLSYNDFWLKLFGGPALAGTRANFFDLANKIAFRPNEKLSLSVASYINNDNYGVDSLFGIDNVVTDKTKFKYGHQNFSAKANYYANDKWNFNLALVWADYKTRTFSPSDSTPFELKTDNDYKAIKLTVTHKLSAKHEFNFGVNAVQYTILPAELNKNITKSPINPLTIPTERGLELSGFVSDDIKISPRLLVEIGARFAQYSSLGAAQVLDYDPKFPKSNATVTQIRQITEGGTIASYNGIEPRLSLKYDFKNGDAIKLGYNRMQQFLQLISNNTTPLPTARWKLADNNIKPQVSDFISLGYFKDAKDAVWEASAEAYYRMSDNILDYVSGANIQLNPHIETQVLLGKGRAYGVELMLTKKQGETTGWISYTYSRAVEKILGDFPQIQQLNDGAWFPTDYDKPHNLNVVITNQVGKHHTFSWTFVYGTGRPYTEPVGIFQQGNYNYPIYTARNNGRISDYHRLDFSWLITNPSLKQRKWEGSWSFTVYNVYGRKNAYSYYFKPNLNGLTPYKLSVFASPFLSLAYNFKLL
jgi:hypothetical protein